MARRITSKRIHLDRLSVKAAVAVVEATKPGRSGTSAEHERRGRADEGGRRKYNNRNTTRFYVSVHGELEKVCALPTQL